MTSTGIVILRCLTFRLIYYDNFLCIVGISALLGVLGFAAYQFKNKKIKTSVFLIHTRVAAQGAVISALTLGVAYHMVNKWIIHGGKDDDEE